MKHINPTILILETSTPLPWRKLRLPIVTMIVVIVLSNVLVQYVISDWLTWGAFSYPLIFLVTDLTNRAIGPQNARRVVYAGFAVAVVASVCLAPWRIALASGSAFLLSQLMDIVVFNRWRKSAWWKAPLLGSSAASVIDTMVFFAIAFAGIPHINWVKLSFGDMGMKLLMAIILLCPYKILLPYLYQYYQKQKGQKENNKINRAD